MFKWIKNKIKPPVYDVAESIVNGHSIFYPRVNGKYLYKWLDGKITLVGELSVIQKYNCIHTNSFREAEKIIRKFISGEIGKERATKINL